MIDPYLSSFLISIAANAATEATKSGIELIKSNDVQSHIKNAFEESINEFSNGNAMERARVDIKKIIQDYLLNPNKENINLYNIPKYGRFFSVFNSKIAERQVAYNYLKEIKDHQRFQTLYSQGAEIHYDINQLTQKLSEVSKDFDNSNIEQDNRYQELLAEIKAKSLYDYQLGIDIIKKLITDLKPISALASLDYIDEKNDKSDRDNRKTVITTHLKGVCYGLMLDMNKSIECFIRAYELDDNKLVAVGSNACLAYAIIGELEKSDQVFNQLIQFDQLNENFWQAKLICTPDEKLELVLNNLPTSLRLIDYFSMVINLRISEVSDIKEVHLLKQKFWKKSTLLLDNNTSIDASNISIIIYQLNEQISNLHISGSLSDCIRNQKLNESSLQCHKNLELFFREIKETEVSSFYPGFEFFLHFFDFIKTRDESFVYKIEELMKRFNTEAKFHFLSLLVNLFTHIGELDMILNILQKQNDKTFELDLVETSILLKLQRYDDYFNKSKTILNKIAHLDFYNFHPIFEMMLQFKVLNLNDKFSIDDCTSIWTFEHDNLRSLIIIQNRIFNNDIDEEILPRLNKIREESYEDDSTILLCIAWLYCSVGDPKSAISIYREFLDFNKPSIHRNTFVKALFVTEPLSVDLLTLLEQIREEQTYLEEFAILELKVSAMIKDLNRAKKVFEYILLNDNKNEQIYLSYLLLLNEMRDNEQIQVEASKISPDFFNNELFASEVAKIFIENKIFKGWEILYEFARFLDNKVARTLYFGNAVMRYGIFMVNTPAEAKIGDFVDYKYNGRKITTEVSKNNTISEFIIGKRIGDEFHYEQNLSEGTVSILAIRNKYQQLFEEINNEAITSPHSGLGIETEKLVMGDPKRIKVLFKDLVFVPPNNLELCIASYYNYEISFSQLINWGYKGDYNKGYLDLIENHHGLVIPILKSYRSFSVEEADSLVLDISSVLAIKDLCDKFEVNFESKFIIARAAYDILISNSKDELDKFKLDKWILKNCIIIQATSKFKDHYLKEYYSQSNVTDYIIETLSIIDEHLNRYLISDDSVFKQLVIMQQKKVMPSKVFVEKWLKQQIFTDHMERNQRYFRKD